MALVGAKKILSCLFVIKTKLIWKYKHFQCCFAILSAKFRNAIGAKAKAIRWRNNSKLDKIRIILKYEVAIKNDKSMNNIIFHNNLLTKLSRKPNETRTVFNEQVSK